MALSIEEREVIAKHIENLPEMEFVELLKEMAVMIRRNKWEHIIDSCFEIETYEAEFDEAKDKIQRLENDLRQAKETLNEIRDLL